MSRPGTPTYKTLNWPMYDEALKRRGSLTVWFDPNMTWEAKPTGRRGRRPVYSDAAVQTCLTMKVLFGMAWRQTTGFVESLLRLIGLGWEVPDFSALSRRQKTLSVNIPHRGSKGPLHLLIDSTGIKVEGEGEWNARKHGAPKRRVWRKVHLGIDEETLEVRAVEITSSDIGDAPMLPELLSQLPPDQEIASVTADGAYDTRKCHHRRTGRRRRHSAPQECEALEGRHRRCSCAQRSAAGVKTPRPRAVATMERIPPPKPCRDENALCETAGSAAHGPRLRPSGRRVPGPCCRPERLHCARHPCHESRGISLSGRRGSPAVSRFVQQSRNARRTLISALPPFMP